ncbi:MAG: hypothetical protein BECKG1743E_GA0114224_107221, partial [Candidatus Kentron sp. G]
MHSERALDQVNGVWLVPCYARLFFTLAYRFRIPRANIRKFPHDWLDIRRLAEKNIPNCAGFSFGFKARGRRI